MKNRLFAFLPVLLACCLLPSPVQAQVYYFKTYTSSTGLPNNAIFCLYQDRKGYMWFGTEGGLCRYDGVNYTIFDIPQGLVDPVVRTIFEDQQGRFWIATEGGVSCYDGVRFTNYTTAQGLPDNATFSGLCARDGTLWFGTANGLCHYDGNRFITYGAAEGVPRKPIWKLVEDRDGTIWMGLRGGGLAKYDGKRFTVFGRADGLPDETVISLALDPVGGMWLGTNGGLCFFDGTRFRTYTMVEGLSSNLSGSVLVDSRHRIWCATFGGGVCRLEHDGHFTVFNHKNGLPDTYLTAIFEDFEGNIWFGTRSSGAVRFSSETFASYSASTGLGEGLVTGMAEGPDGTLWFSSRNNGLTALDPTGQIRRYGVKEGFPEDGIWSLCVDRQGRVWTGSYRGVSCFDGHRLENFTREQMGAADRITSIIEDRQGRMWFGSYTSTSNGVVMYDGRTFTRYGKEHGFVTYPVNGFTLDHTGLLWICSDIGLTSFDGERFTTYQEKDGLPPKRMLCVYEDEQGVLWVGSNTGLCRFTGKGSRIYTTEDGLVSNRVRTITSREGVLWIGTSGGISTFDGQRFRNYTVTDGLISNDISTGMCLKQHDQSLWFATNEGVVRYRPTIETHQSLPPRVHLDAVRVQGKAPAQTIDVELKTRGDAPALQYDQNSVIFEFLGLSFKDETAVRYSTLLEGFDHEWSLPRPERWMRFTNLPPGHYRFFVKAVSTSGVWSDPQVVEITIRPPYWQTWWFRFSVAAGLVMLVYGWYARRIRLLKQHQKQKLAHIRHLQEQRIATLRQLLESIRVINSELDIGVVLEKIAEESALLVGGEPGGIGLVEGHEVVFKQLWLNDHWEDCNFRFRLGEGVAGRAAATGKTIIEDQPQTSIEIKFPEAVKKYSVHGMMEVPIFSRTGKVVGVLDVRRLPDSPPFTDADRQLIESLANQAAVAVENAALYGELGAKNVELEDKNLQLEEKNLMIVEAMREMEKLYQNEQEVTHSLHELDRMKTNFLIVTSHEMRTPLTVLKGYTEALIDECLGPLTDVQERALGNCRRMIERMVTSFNDILEMLKIHEGRTALRYTNFNLTTTVQEVLKELGGFIEKRRQQVICDLPESLPLSADQEKIQLVLVNLIQNAIKFTHDDGEIRIGVTCRNDEVHLTIADSGIGVEAAEIGRIFEKFYTTADPSNHTSGKFEFLARGTGLGLAIAKSYTEAHGGRIWADSAGVGHGTCFHVVLPFVSAAQGAMLTGHVASHD